MSLNDKAESSISSAPEAPISTAQSSNEPQHKLPSHALIAFVIVIVLVIGSIAYFVSRPQKAPSHIQTTQTITIPNTLNISLTHNIDGMASLISSLWLGIYNTSVFSVGQFAAALAEPGSGQPDMNATFAFSSSPSSFSVPFNLTIRFERIGGDYRVDTIEFALNTGLDRIDSISFVNGIYNLTIWNLTPPNEQPKQVFASVSNTSIAPFVPTHNRLNVIFQVTGAYNSSFNGIKCLDITGNLSIILGGGNNAPAYGKFDDCISYKYDIPLNLSMNVSTGGSSYDTLYLRLVSINNNPSQSYIDSVPG